MRACHAVRVRPAFEGQRVGAHARYTEVGIYTAAGDDTGVIAQVLAAVELQLADARVYPAHRFATQSVTRSRGELLPGELQVPGCLYAGHQFVDVRQEFERRARVKQGDPVTGRQASGRGDTREIRADDRDARAGGHRYHVPVFCMLDQGSRGARRSPACSSSTEMPSGERMKAI